MTSERLTFSGDWLSRVAELIDIRFVPQPTHPMRDGGTLSPKKLGAKRSTYHPMPNHAPSGKRRRQWR